MAINSIGIESPILFLNEMNEALIKSLTGKKIEITVVDNPLPLVNY